LAVRNPEQKENMPSLRLIVVTRNPNESVFANGMAELADMIVATWSARQEVKRGRVSIVTARSLEAAYRLLTDAGSGRTRPSSFSPRARSRMPSR